MVIEKAAKGFNVELQSGRDDRKNLKTTMFNARIL